MVSVVVHDRAGTPTLITKGAPETVLARCVDVPTAAQAALEAEFAAGNRVVALATRPASGTDVPVAADERELTLAGLLVFLDPPKQDAAQALEQLAGLGITVKVVTNAQEQAGQPHECGGHCQAQQHGTDLEPGMVLRHVVEDRVTG